MKVAIYVYIHLDKMSFRCEWDENIKDVLKFFKRIYLKLRFDMIVVFFKGTGFVLVVCVVSI